MLSDATPHGTSHSQFRTLDNEILSSSSSTVSDDSDILIRLNPTELPDIDQLQQQDVVAEAQAQAVKGEETPKPTPMVLPPTPADTLRDIDIRRANEIVEEAPPTATMPVIPDQNEWGFNEGWEEIDRNEVPPASHAASHNQSEHGNSDAGDQHEKNLPPTPDDSGIQMPVPEPASPPSIPVPSPHHSSRHDTLDPPPSFEDIYGPDANDVPYDAPPSKSLIDFEGNDDRNEYDAGNYADEAEGVHGDEEARDEGGDAENQHLESNTPPPETQNNQEENDGQEQEQDQPQEQDQQGQDQPEGQDQQQELDQQQEQDSPQLPPPSPSPPPSPVLATPLPLPERVDEAVLLHQTISDLAREVEEAKQAQGEADKSGDKAGAIAEAVTVASKERALERAKKRLARRIFVGGYFLPARCSSWY